MCLSNHTSPRADEHPKQDGEEQLRNSIHRSRPMQGGLTKESATMRSQPPLSQGITEK